MNSAMLACVVSIAVASGGYLRGQTREVTPNRNCSAGERCNDLKVPADIAGTPTYAISNASKDLTAVNLGYKVDLTWKNAPPAALWVHIYRAASERGPWAKLGKWRTSDLPGSFFTDVIDGTRKVLYYRVELTDASGKPKRQYRPVRVPRYGR